MSLQFIMGNSGAGKSRYAYEKILAEAARHPEKNYLIVVPNGTTFDDVKLISDWARESVSTMNSMKIMEGVSDTEFAPKGNYTVEQAIATMVRLYNCY